MMKNYKTNVSKLNAKLKFGKLLKACLVPLMVLLFTADTYGQCITGGNGTETVGYAATQVTNAPSAIDANFTTTAATITLTGVFTSASLDINFTKTVNPGDSIYFIIGQGSTAINLALFGGITGTAYTGTATSASATPSGSAIGTNSASTFLSLLVIGGVSYQALAIGVDPTSTTGANSIQLTYSALVSVGSALNVYGVYVVPGPPTAIDKSICYGNLAALQATKQTIGSSTIDVEWFGSTDTTGTILKKDVAQSGSPYTSTFVTPALTATRDYYVRQSTSGCGLYSPLTNVTANVNPQLNVVASYSCTGTNTAKTLRVIATPNGGTSGYTYAWTASNGGNITGTATASNPTVNANGTYTVVVTDAKGCTKTQFVIISGFSNAAGSGSCAVVLPALGLTLGGSVTSGKPVLTWSTLQEVNTSYFSIEASSNGIDYTSLGKVAAAGNSSVPASYSFTDGTSTSAVVYYRVKLVDVDGGVAYSNVFSLRLSGSALAKIYPNPVTNFVNIETGAAGTYVAELFTVDGRKLSSTSLSTASGLVTFTINRSNVTSGAYLLRVTNKATATSTYNTIMVK